jgi:hypothetical protein
MKTHGAQDLRARTATRVVAAVVIGAGLLLSVIGAAVSSSAAQAASPAAKGSTTYSATATIPVPLPSLFAGSAGGDGWAVAASATEVFNVFHHQPTLQVNCHLKSNAQPCWAGPETIKDPQNHEFATSDAPGLYLDPTTGDMYVFAVRTTDSTAGVVCINTTLGVDADGSERYCGFTPLSAVGDAPLDLTATAGVSDPVQVGSDWYAFNEVAGEPTGTEDTLLCFDLATDTACDDQPYALDLDGDQLTPFDFAAEIGVTGSDVVVQVVGSTDNELACYNTSAGGSCLGAWPVEVSSIAGAPFALENTAGTDTGICLPVAGEPCYSSIGTTVATPPGLDSIGTTSQFDGPPYFLGTRVYVPNDPTNSVDCYNFATSSTCANFPKVFQNLDALYTVNPDPYRPDCLWVNSDHGADQIQNFDAYTGGACPSGPVAVDTSSILAPYKKCLPTQYSSLQVLSPARKAYQSATVQVDNSSGTPLTGIPVQTVDGTGSVDLSPLDIVVQSTTPEFEIDFSGWSNPTKSIQIRLSWVAADVSKCQTGTTTVGNPGSSTLPFTGAGYRLVAADGGLFAFGDAPFYGSTGNITLNRPVVGMATTPDGKGYWLVASDGGLFAFGDARFYGSTGSIALNKPVVAMAATPDGKGYWLVASDGGIFAFGDAHFYGSTGGTALNKPIVGMASTPDGKGYWLVASDGGIFAFGDAAFHGSTGNITLNKPIVGMASTPNGKGYWLVATDGGIFAFGDAAFHGSAGGITLNKPVVGMAATPDGNGYWLVATDGGIFSYGDAAFHGSTGGITLNKPVVGMASAP